MQYQQQGQQSAGQQPLGDLRSQFNTMCNVAQVLAFPVSAWTTRLGTWGANYLAAPALAGCVWPLVFAALYGPHPRLGDVYDFWGLTLALVALHGVAGAWRRGRGYHAHSRYWGESWLEGEPGGLSARSARLAGGVLALGAGYAASAGGSAPLGALLVLGGAARLFSDVLAFRAVGARVRQMEDARLESEFYAAEARGRQW